MFRRLGWMILGGWLGVACASPVVAYHLKNGLEVRFKPDHRAPVVLTEMWYKIGASYEPMGLTGISHFLEHMMFRGTKTVGPGEFSRIVAENGGVENAFTSADYTGYYQMMPASQLETSLRLEADRMHNLVIRQEDYEKERQVVMEERRLRVDDAPHGITHERFMSVAHIASPYHHPTIGWMSDVRQLTVADLQRWYQRWYAPNNAVLVVVGDANLADVKRWVQQYFGPIKRKTIIRPKPQHEVRPLGKRQLVVQVPAKLPWLLMGYNVPVIKTAKEVWEPYALAVLSGVLGGGGSARFTQKLVRDQQVATSVGVEYSPFSRLDAVLTISATPAAGVSVDQLEKAIAQEIQAMAHQPISAYELARVKAQVIAGRVFEEDSLQTQASNIGVLESVGLSWRDYDDFLKKVQAVTAEQVRRVALRYLTSKRQTVARLQPEEVVS